MAATIAPTDDEVYVALFDWVAGVLGLGVDTLQIVKGFQNLSAAPTGSYVVLSPGLMQRQDFGRKVYVPPADPAVAGAVEAGAHITYSWQLYCYGVAGPNWASMLSVAWRTMWGVDTMGRAPVFTPLYADAPQQLNIVNSEGQFEQRFMIRLFGQVNQVVTLPLDFFSAIELDSIIPADLLP